MAPLVIGIAGGTGSGKTTVARKIAAALPTGSVSTIEHDSYYRDRGDLTPEQREQLNFDHPESLETELLCQHVMALKSGQAVSVPIYDFKTHRRSGETHAVEPTPLIIVEGILVFVEPSLRELLDIKIFVDTDADIRVFRRVRRDIEHRGRTFESVREQYYKTVRPMHLQFVEPSKRWADLILPEGGNQAVALDLIIAKLQSVVSRSPGFLRTGQDKPRAVGARPARESSRRKGRAEPVPPSPGRAGAKGSRLRQAPSRRRTHGRLANRREERAGLSPSRRPQAGRGPRARG